MRRFLLMQYPVNFTVPTKHFGKVQGKTDLNLEVYKIMVIKQSGMEKQKHWLKLQTIFLQTVPLSWVDGLKYLHHLFFNAGAAFKHDVQSG